MKHKTIETGLCILLLVELPEGSYYPNICNLPPYSGVHYFIYENGVNTPYKEPLHIIKDNWKLIGRLPELTEEQSGRIVVFHPKQKGGVQKYVAAKDALNNLLQANGILFENPIRNDDRLRFTEWLEYQSNLWDRNNTYIFKQVK